MTERAVVTDDVFSTSPERDDMVYVRSGLTAEGIDTVGVSCEIGGTASRPIAAVPSVSTASTLEVIGCGMNGATSTVDAGQRAARTKAGTEGFIGHGW